MYHRTKRQYSVPFTGGFDPTFGPGFSGSNTSQGDTDTPGYYPTEPAPEIEPTAAPEEPEKEEGWYQDTLEEAEEYIKEELSDISDISISTLPGYDLPIEVSIELLLSGGGLYFLNGMLFNNTKLDKLGMVAMIAGTYLITAKSINFFEKPTVEKIEDIGDSLQDDFDSILPGFKKNKDDNGCPPWIAGYIGPVPVFGAYSIGRYAGCKLGLF